jgi:hypothetical protein
VPRRSATAFAKTCASATPCGSFVLAFHGDDIDEYEPRRSPARCASETCSVGQHRDDRVAADIRATPSDLAVRVEHDAVSGGVAPDECLPPL